MLKVANHQIVNAEDEPVRLRGFNIGGWLNLEDFINGYVGAEHNLRATMARILGEGKARFFFDRLLDHFFTEDDVIAMKAMGANVLRLPFNYRHFERDDAPFEYLEAGFERLDKAMDWCGSHGISVILDFHAVQGWHNPDWHSDNAHVHIMLYEHKLFQDRFVGLWEQMARRYKDHPALAGYDIMNEPFTRLEYERYEPSYYDWDSLNAVHRRAVAAIRAIDGDHLIFLEGDNFSTEFDGLDVTFDPNIVVSTHNYNPATGGGEPYPGKIGGRHWNRDVMAGALGMHSGTRLAMKHGKPIFVGEFGVWYANHLDAIEYRAKALSDQLGVFESVGAHWAIWTWKDIASMGAYNLAPDSEYLRLIAPILRAKRQAADTDTASSPVSMKLKELGDTIDATLKEVGISTPINRTWFAQYGLFGYLAQFLQLPYAELFKEKSETQIDEILQAFRLEQCVRNEPVAQVLEQHLAP